MVDCFWLLKNFSWLFQPNIETYYSEEQGAAIWSFAPCFAQLDNISILKMFLRSKNLALKSIGALALGFKFMETGDLEIVDYLLKSLTSFEYERIKFFSFGLIGLRRRLPLDIFASLPEWEKDYISFLPIIIGLSYLGTRYSEALDLLQKIYEEYIDKDIYVATESILGMGFVYYKTYDNDFLNKVLEIASDDSIDEAFRANAILAAALAFSGSRNRDIYRLAFKFLRTPYLILAGVHSIVELFKNSGDESLNQLRKLIKFRDRYAEAAGALAMGYAHYSKAREEAIQILLKLSNTTISEIVPVIAISLGLIVDKTKEKFLDYLLPLIESFDWRKTLIGVTGLGFAYRGTGDEEINETIINLRRDWRNLRMSSYVVPYIYLAWGLVNQGNKNLKIAKELSYAVENPFYYSEALRAIGIIFGPKKMINYWVTDQLMEDDFLDLEYSTIYLLDSL